MVKPLMVEPFDIVRERDQARRALRPVAEVRSGFSLIDLLVSIAVMVVLISILAPSMMNAQESARRVRCASNVRQLGLALQMYSDDSHERLPDAKYGPPVVGSTPRANSRTSATSTTWSGDTMYVRVAIPVAPTARQASATGGGASVPKRLVWDGLGALKTGNYLNHPEVFYCPSHHGRHNYRDYSTKWSKDDGEIAANYQYRVPEDPYLPKLQPKFVLVADGMATKSDYNHIVGNNYLRADMSVAWFADLTGELYDSLPEDTSVAVGGNGRGWNVIDSRTAND